MQDDIIADHSEDASSADRTDAETAPVEDSESDAVKEIPQTDAEVAAALEQFKGLDTGPQEDVGELVLAKPPAEADVSEAKAPKAVAKDADGAAPETDEEEEELPELIVAPPDDGIKRRWYAIHAHSGQEGSVQQALIAKSEQAGLEATITNVFVPMEEVAEYKSGEKRVSKRKFFPGYVLVQLPEHPERNADLWHLIKDTPGVTGFIGSRTEPVPLEDSEVMALVEEMRGERERPRPKLAYEVGERVKINDGAFANFMGNIGEINEDRGKMKVLIEIFERQTSVEVEFWQVEKI